MSTFGSQIQCCPVDFGGLWRSKRLLDNRFDIHGDVYKLENGQFELIFRFTDILPWGCKMGYFIWWTLGVIILTWLYITWQWVKCVEFRFRVFPCVRIFHRYLRRSLLGVWFNPKSGASLCLPMHKIHPKFYKWGWINWGRELTSDIIEFQLFMVFIKAENFWLYSTSQYRSFI